MIEPPTRRHLSLLGDSAATFSRDERYRYTLTRTWDHDGPPVLFIMLNPSTADGAANDPTIRRCIGFAKAWGYGSLLVGNLFALRSTDPKLLRSSLSDPVGPLNDQHLQTMAREARMVICAWGADRFARGRAAEVLTMLPPSITCRLGTTTDGSPRHPLYVPGETMPMAYAVHTGAQEATR